MLTYSRLSNNRAPSVEMPESGNSRGNIDIVKYNWTVMGQSKYMCLYTYDY